MTSRWLASAALALLVAGAAGGGGEGDQLAAVRARIRALEGRLATVQAERAGASEERARLSSELALAEARVRELELVLAASRDEIVRLRDEAAELGSEIERRRHGLGLHLQMMALLGRPGPLQLLFDAARGGNLEQAFGTVSVLTVGQVRLVEEYGQLQRARSERLADLSVSLDAAEREAQALVARRRLLAELRDRVATRLAALERSERQTSTDLDDMREREQSLGRLVELLAARQRPAAGDDIRRYRGALPWPARGRVVQSFGRHYLPRYATYTVCNGIHLDVAAGTPVAAGVSGVVAYAQHFKGYGNMVVVDHGRRVFSLVAGLASIWVRVNQSVAMGTQLGMASTPGEQGNLYLEVRVAEQPQDPLRWLQLREGGS